jgi:EAL domain-containing protein (putative c-di-GMP-specific phosphodiesterase class I)
MANELRRAIDDDRLSVHYQPIVDLVTGRAVAVEALARWEGGVFGAVPPSTFIGLAEDLGMIERLGESLLRTACRQLATWRARFHGAAPEYGSVNLSVRQLNGDGLIDTVLTALRDSRLPADRLCLELTESVFMDDIERSVSLLEELRAFGVRLAMDDFGTGYSALSSLRRFPGHVMNIDRSFVMGLRSESAGAAIIAAVVDMANAVGLTPVPEGVESQAEADLLRQLGITLAQGFHLAPPMPPEEFARWLSGRARVLAVAGERAAVAG